MSEAPPRNLRIPGMSRALVESTVLEERQIVFNLGRNWVHIGDGVTLGGRVYAGVDSMQAGIIPLFGEGPPDDDLGIVGSFYYDTSNFSHVFLYGPKTEEGWGEGRDLHGLDAAPPDRVDFTAETNGQVRFPPTGTFEDLDPPFNYAERPLAVVMNGQILVPGDDYDAPGGFAPIILKSGDGVVAGQTKLSVHGFLLEGEDSTTLMKRMSFMIGKSAYQKATEAISLDDGRSANDTDDNTILAEKMADGYRTIILLPGKGALAGGAYGLWTPPWTVAPVGGDFDTGVSSPGNILPGARLIGRGRYQSVIKTLGNGFALMFNSKSGDPNDNAKGFYFEEIGFEGISTADNFVETDHLTAFAGTTGLRFRGCRFVRYRGDAVYLTRGFKPTDPAINFDTQFHDCDWDSVYKNSRAAISAESIDGLGVYASRFRRGTKDNMPAFITVEPLKYVGGYQARGINIIGNNFDDYNGAAVAMNIGDSETYGKTPQVRIMANDWSNGVLGVDVYGGVLAANLPGLTKDHEIRITHNTATSISKPLRLRGTSGVQYRFNGHTDVDAILLGNLENQPNQRAAIDDNKFRRSGLATGSTLLIDDSALDCSFSRNDITDSGFRAAGPAAITILGRAGDVDIRINDNRVSDPNNRLLANIIMSAGVTSVSVKSEKEGNQLPFGALPVADNFSPPRRKTGVVATETYPGLATLTAGSLTINDIPAPGATIGMKFDVSFDNTPGASDAILTNGFCRIPNVIRSIIYVPPTATAVNIPAGTTRTMRQI